MTFSFTNPITPRVVDVHYECPFAPPVFVSAELVKNFPCADGRCGPGLTVTVPLGRFFAPTQAEADAAALAYADAQGASWLGDCGWPSDSFDQDFTCSNGFEGGSVHVHFDAGEFCAESTGVANALALASAQEIADGELVCEEGAVFQSRSDPRNPAVRGFSEFVASSPPRKYLTKSVEGYICTWSHDPQYSYNSCEGYAAGTNVKGSRRHDTGACTYDPNTGVITNSLVRTTSGSVGDVQSLADACALPIVSTEAPPACDPYGPAMYGAITVDTPTTRTWHSDGVCHHVNIGVTYLEAYLIQPSDHPTVETLSNEDTENAAIAREFASPAWSAWSTVPQNTDPAIWQVRTTGFDFFLTKAQWRIVQLGLVPGSSHSYYVDLYRRTHAVGPYSLFATVPVVAVADGSGRVDVSADVLNVRGFDTFASFPGTPP